MLMLPQVLVQLLLPRPVAVVVAVAAACAALLGGSIGSVVATRAASATTVLLATTTLVFMCASAYMDYGSVNKEQQWPLLFSFLFFLFGYGSTTHVVLISYVPHHK
jgi:hypothetical protein